MLTLLKLRYAFKWILVCLIINLFSIGIVAAQPELAEFPLELSGQWFQAPDHWAYYYQADLSDIHLTPVSATKNTGGHFFFQSDFVVTKPGILVVDFKNSSVIGRFHHYVFDGEGKLVQEVEGGIQSKASNPFQLRHGRELDLPIGHYRLITELSSPFYLAQPQPYLDTHSQYEQHIKTGNALVLLCLGSMFALIVYFVSLAVIRRQITEFMYSLFILGNIFYNGTALLFFSDLLGIHYFYLISVPILFSNIAYISFATTLLNINRRSHHKLYIAAQAIVAVMMGLILIAPFAPNWSLEFARYGVGMMMPFGLIAGAICAYQGNRTARTYLLAIIPFFVIGSYAITNAKLDGIYTIYIEHIGLLAVMVEMLLLSLVVARQFAQLHEDKEMALYLAKEHLRVAHTDALTGLPNRYALDLTLATMPQTGMLVFLDMDGLKFYNDNFGHKKGDELLCTFSTLMRSSLPEPCGLYRIGGDEFAITCPSGNIKMVEQKLADTVKGVHNAGFDFSGMSYGSAVISEAEDKNALKHLADTRMYENKRLKKQKDIEDKNKVAQ
jgi:diguanylate cyclase (GGDEF)-like protein